jgi:hypothetical protein
VQLWPLTAEVNSHCPPANYNPTCYRNVPRLPLNGAFRFTSRFPTLHFR